LSSETNAVATKKVSKRSSAFFIGKSFRFNRTQ
jgi:hypothetical protein